MSSDRHPAAAPPHFTIDSSIAGSFLGRGPDDRSVLIVPVTSATPPLDRATGDVVLSFRQQGTFALNTRTFASAAAIIECADAALGDTFHVLAEDIAKRMRADSMPPTPLRVSQALAQWEQLLRGRRELSRDQEIGLWGELWMLQQLHPTDTGVSTWRGPDAEFVDFVGGGIGIECKTSRRRLEHFVSQQQVTRPLGDLAVYLLSLWVDHDPVEGKTLGDMVAKCDAQLSDRREFEEKLLISGYSRADAVRYRQKLRLLEPPLVFPAASIPRVREADPGISQIRFLVSLDERKAVSYHDALSLLGRLCVT